MIGVHTVLNRPDATELKYLKKKINKFNGALHTFPINHTDAWLLYTMMLLLSINYFFPALKITQKDAQDLEPLFMPVLTWKSGYSKLYPKSLLYGSPQHI
eukprot:3851571-Ditylum_brightwellii.AAC.1